MRKLLLLIAILFICCAASVFIEAPGSGGMNSRVDTDQVQKNESRYTENGNIFEHPGRIIKRNGLVSFGANIINIYGAHGFTSTTWGYKNILALSDRIDSVIVKIDTLPAPDTQMYYVFPSDTTVNTINISDAGRSRPSANIMPNSLMGGGDYDFCNVREFVIASDGENIPHVFVSRYDSLKDSTGAHDGDNEYYFPRTSTIGMEAPGQLRVTPSHSNEGTARTGLYRYAYHYKASQATYTSIPSRWVELNSQNCLASLFEGRADSAAGDTTWYILWRQKYTEPWYSIDTFTALIETPTSFWPLHYLDSLPDNTGTNMGTHPAKLYGVDVRRAGNSLVPGAFYQPTTGFVYDSTNFNVAFDEDLTAFDDSVYYAAYSYYDPISEIESPLGPANIFTLVDSVDDATEDSIWIYGLQKSITNEHARSRWVRCYRSLSVRSNGGGYVLPGETPDKYVLYGVHQLRSNVMYSDNVALYKWTWFPGWGSDDDLITGIDSEAVDIYQGSDILRDENAAIITRPPYISACEIPFSDVEYANYRLWGIGDPIYPIRLYYAEFDQLHDWSPINYLNIGTERDELVALSKLPYGDGEVLIIFAHNSIYLLGGEDVEYDASVNTVTTKCGAVSRKSIVTTDDEIFFLSPNMKIYSMTTGAPKEISGPVENYIDTIFTNYTTAKTNARALRTADKIVFFAQDSKKGLAFDLLSRTWQVETYYTDVMIEGSFRHDSTSGSGYSEYDWWIFQIGIDTVAGPVYEGKGFLHEIASAVVDTYETSDSALTYSFPFHYQTPFYGDGQFLSEIRELQFTAKGDNGKYLFLTIYDEDEDSLLTDSVAFASAEMQDYRTAFAYHQGKRLSVKFWTKSDAATKTNIFELSDFKIDLRRIATNAIN